MSVTFSKPLIYGNILFFGTIILVTLFFGFQKFSNEWERESYKDYIPSYLEKPQNSLPN
jgi:hypothetical protein